MAGFWYNYHYTTRYLSPSRWIYLYRLSTRIYICSYLLFAGSLGKCVCVRVCVVNIVFRMTPYLFTITGILIYTCPCHIFIFINKQTSKVFLVYAFLSCNFHTFREINSRTRIRFKNTLCAHIQVYSILTYSRIWWTHAQTLSRSARATDHPIQHRVAIYDPRTWANILLRQRRQYTHSQLAQYIFIKYVIFLRARASLNMKWVRSRIECTSEV